MRVELEHNQMSLNEFIDSLGAMREPVELTRDGEVVATLSSTKAKKSAKAARAPNAFAGDPKRAAAAAELKKLHQKIRARTMRPDLSERQAIKRACDIVERARKENAAARAR